MGVKCKASLYILKKNLGKTLSFLVKYTMNRKSY